MIAFDTTFLTLMFVPGAKHAIADAEERIRFLISDIHGSGEKILIPTPALSEILVKSGPAKNQIATELTGSPKFQIGSFDVKSALELATMTDAAFTRGDKRDGAKGPYVKVKFDRQVVAIAKAYGARTMYSDDGDVKAICEREELPCLGVADIVVPAKNWGLFGEKI
jgi:hypothetical protein